MLDTLPFQHVVHPALSNIVHKKKRITYGTSIRHDKRSENLVSIPYSGQSNTLMMYRSVRPPILTPANTINPPPPYGDLSSAKAGLFRAPCSLQMSTHLLSDSTLNHDLSEKRTDLHSACFHPRCSSAQFLRSLRCCGVNLVHTMGLRAQRPLP